MTLEIAEGNIHVRKSQGPSLYLSSKKEYPTHGKFPHSGASFFLLEPSTMFFEAVSHWPGTWWVYKVDNPVSPKDLPVSTFTELALQVHSILRIELRPSCLQSKTWLIELLFQHSPQYLLTHVHILKLYNVSWFNLYFSKTLSPHLSISTSVYVSVHKCVKLNAHVPVQRPEVHAGFNTGITGISSCFFCGCRESECGSSSLHTSILPTDPYLHAFIFFFPIKAFKIPILCTIYLCKNSKN